MEKMNQENNNIISKEVFEKEIELCQKLFKENNGQCCWGSCDSCGVIPCLYKLYKGDVIDGADELKQFRNQFLR